MHRTDDILPMNRFEVHRVENTHDQVDDTVVTPEGVAEPIIHVFGYDDEGNHHHEKIRGFEPYCYVRYEYRDWARAHSEVKRVEVRTDEGERFESVRGERLARCVTYGTGGVSDLESETSNSDAPIEQTWESDVLFPNRFIADMDLESGVQVLATDSEYVHLSNVKPIRYHTDWRIHYVDIEVDDRNGFPENGREPILCITAYDSFMSEYIVWVWEDDELVVDTDYPTDADLHDAPVSVRQFDEEEHMLRNYFAFVSGTNPSVYTAWNVEFDLTYLWDRAQHLNEQRDAKLPYESMSPIFETQDHDYFGQRIRGTVVFDLLQGLKSTQYTDMSSYRLEDVAQEFLDVGKEKYVGTVGQLWEDSPVELVEYNLRDVELCVLLDEQQSLVDFWRQVSRIGRCQMEDATVESSVVDKYLLNALHGEYVLPRKGSQPNVEGSYEGGAVFSAVNGLYHNVPMLDLASLYPMSMLTCNISPETKVNPDEYDGDTYVSPNGIHFRKDKEGITKRVIDDLLDRREEKKTARDEHDPDTNRYKVLDNQQRALKVIMNSLYGVLAWNRFRLYDQDGARATTATGREVLAFTAEVAEEMGYPVLYGDTDSVLLNLNDDLTLDEVIDIAFDVEDEINNRYQEFAEDMLNAERHFFDIEFEKLYERFFQSGAKKRYAGRIRWKEGKEVDDISITGYEYQRSDASELANQSQEQVLRMICEDATPDEVASYIRSQIRRVQNKEVTLDEIGIPEGIGKALDDYQSPTHSVRAAKYGNLLLGTSFSSGSKPKRYYLSDIDDSFWYDREQDGMDVESHPLYVRAREELPFLGVTRPEQLPGECHIDWETHEAKCLKQTLHAITSALGLEWDDLRTDSKQTELEAFV